MRHKRRDRRRVWVGRGGSIETETHTQRKGRWGRGEKYKRRRDSKRGRATERVGRRENGRETER